MASRFFSNNKRYCSCNKTINNNKTNQIINDTKAIINTTELQKLKDRRENKWW